MCQRRRGVPVLLGVVVAMAACGRTEQRGGSSRSGSAGDPPTQPLGGSVSPAGDGTDSKGGQSTGGNSSGAGAPSVAGGTPPQVTPKGGSPILSGGQVGGRSLRGGQPGVAGTAPGIADGPSDLTGGHGGSADGCGDSEPCFEGLTCCAGECVDLGKARGHCGNCGAVCLPPHAVSDCRGGVCQYSCEMGYADCNRDATDGCEANLLASFENCGSCGSLCAAKTGVPSCIGGVCAVSICPEPYAECDGLPETACETNLSADQKHCGACGRVCTGAHASSTCSSGQCVIDACDLGFASCDGTAANGCEADLSQSSSCGGCGYVCGKDQTCVAGACT